MSQYLMNVPTKTSLPVYFLALHNESLYVRFSVSNILLTTLDVAVNTDCETYMYKGRSKSLSNFCLFEKVYCTSYIFVHCVSVCIGHNSILSTFSVFKIYLECTGWYGIEFAPIFFIIFHIISFE